MSKHPHVPAAFINALAEEGTKDEALSYLQKTWNKLCALKAEMGDWQQAAKVEAKLRREFLERAEKAEAERDNYRDLLDSNVSQMGKQLAELGRERDRLRAEVDALSRAQRDEVS